MQTILLFLLNCCVNKNLSFEKHNNNPNQINKIHSDYGTYKNTKLNDEKYIKGALFYKNVFVIILERIFIYLKLLQIYYQK